MALEAALLENWPDFRLEYNQLWLRRFVGRSYLHQFDDWGYIIISKRPCKVVAALRRQNPRPLREKIGNLDQIPDFDVIEAASKLALSELAPPREP